MIGIDFGTGIDKSVLCVVQNGVVLLTLPQEPPDWEKFIKEVTGRRRDYLVKRGLCSPETLDDEVNKIWVAGRPWGGSL